MTITCNSMKRTLLALMALASFEVAYAFSLIGPYDTWMTSTNGFRQTGDIGGPQNLGEEYRWNVPVLTYSFDESFLSYFGSNGVAAVSQAIAVLNSLPPVSQLDPLTYPPETRSVNFQAQAANLVDLKSRTLAVLLEQMGLGQPTRSTFCIHDFVFNGGILNAQVVQRNFDAITFSITNRVNDSAYNYSLPATTNGAVISVDAVEFLINPLAMLQPAVADGALETGDYYTGLTRDDVGGLRYLLRTNNANIEILLPNVHGIGANAGNYANQALRQGVEKVTFVQRDYDSLLNQFFTPYTNQFTDTYISNSVVVQQQLERVVTVPDILFSADNGGAEEVNSPQVFRTGTTNWWMSPVFVGNGPGLIRPPIKLSFALPTESVTTSDAWPPGSAVSFRDRWGAYDGSTNAPVVFPAGTGADLALKLCLLRGETEVGRKSWQITLAPGASVVVQTSTNLVDWSPHLVFLAGETISWTHHCSTAQRFFRIMPNN